MTVTRSAIQPSRLPSKAPVHAQQTPTRSLSISTSTSKHPSSIASSKAPAPSWSSYWKPSDHDVPRLTKTPWEEGRHKRNSTLRQSKTETQFPARIFQQLPREIYNCIVVQLEALHLQLNQACSACYLRDLHSLSLTSRAWDRATVMQMYQRIYVNGHDDRSQSQRRKLKGPGRLKLLRRTLRERHSMARLVQELHLPDFQTLYQQASIEREEIVNLVASLVMACPSLERLVGFHIPFTQSFDRLSYALATRSNLRERVWLLSESQDGYLDREDNDEVNDYYLAACDPMEHFIGLNSGHSLLTTIVLHQRSGDTGPTLNFRAIIGSLRRYPILQHLSVSGLPATSFTNVTLNALPSGLRSLRLENLPGINDKGLQKFATSHLATSLEKLVLINLELSSMITIMNILSKHLCRLQQFTIVQYRTPDLHSRSSISDLSSPFLEFLHFEFRSQSGPPIDPFSPEMRKSMEFPFTNSEPISCLATSFLAKNIKEGAFPRLRRIRIPHDPQGLIQAVCKPRATALLPSDTSLFTRPIHENTSHEYAIMVESHQSSEKQDSHYTIPPSPRADSAIDSPTFDLGPCSSAITPSKTRLAAQARILAARKNPLVVVRVYDPEGNVRIDTAIGGYLGDVKSNIMYDLKPDANRWPGSRDQTGPPQPEWITGIEDLADERTVVYDRTHQRHWGNCGHRVGGRVGRHSVRVEKLFSEH